MHEEHHLTSTRKSVIIIDVGTIAKHIILIWWKRSISFGKFFFLYETKENSFVFIIGAQSISNRFSLLSIGWCSLEQRFQFAVQSLSLSRFIARWILNEQKKGGSESCHHDLNHDMVYTCSLSRIITTIETNLPFVYGESRCCFQTRITRSLKRIFSICQWAEQTSSIRWWI